jgi:hypothetical protein
MVFAHTVDGRKYTFREDFNADQMPLADYKGGRTPAGTIPRTPATRPSRRHSTGRRWTSFSSWPYS